MVSWPFWQDTPGPAASWDRQWPAPRRACHRVVYRDGRLSPPDIFGGPGIQRFLLEQEGVPFLADGRVDLSRCLWTAARRREEFLNERHF